ncbi:MAG: PQQ-dependent sugar dehydrogenase [Vicinamibacterales bacterium]
MARRLGVAIAVALGVSVPFAAIAQPVISPPVPLTGTPVEQPVVSRSENGLSVRVVPLAKGLSHPTGMVFLPDGHTILLVERPGRLRVVKDGVLDPNPVAGVPAVHNLSLGGIHDILLHPDFANNRLLYISYSKEGSQGTTTLAIARARFEPSGLTAMQDILVAEAWGSPLGTYGGRMIFGPDGLLYVAVGDRDGNTRDDNSPARKEAQSLAHHTGKVLRLRDDGSIPPDNPFVNDPKAKGEIYTYGHRNPYGLAFHPETGELWASEFGAAGGDELNLLVPGHNYGWPLVSLGRNYTGTLVSDQPWWRPGMDMPFFHWNPVINPSNMIFYTGKKLAGLTGSLVVAGAGTKRIVWLRFSLGMARQVDSMLRELNVRFRDIRQGPDELIYVLTEGRSRGNQDTDGMLLRIEPVADTN